MGICSSSLTPEEAEKRKRSKDLENQMAAQARQEAEKIKLLLLGAGESGKRFVNNDLA